MAKALLLDRCDGGATIFQEEALPAGYRRLPAACGLASASDVGRILARNGTNLAGASERCRMTVAPIARSSELKCGIAANPNSAIAAMYP